MQRRKLLQGFVLVLLVLSLGATLFTGGLGFFHAPAFKTELNLSVPIGEAKPPYHTSINLPCQGKPGNPVIYYANDPLAEKYNDFGTPLDPRLSPLSGSYSPQPDVHQIVTASWDRLCHDPALTRAIVAAAFPSWGGLRSFEWTEALNKLYGLDWDKAQMVYHTDPPTSWTMMMHGKSGAIPTTSIVRARHGGWYLRITVDGSHELLLRSGCGDQPSLDLRTGYSQAVLTGIFPVS